MIIRTYTPSDYPTIKSLYEDSSTFGGQYDEARDTAKKLDTLIEQKPDVILVAVEDGRVVGTVTLFEDGRSAWLYRFAIEKEYEKEATKMLWEKAAEILKQKGHTQVLVYAPAGDREFEHRYTDLGFKKGNDFTAYWLDL